MPISPVRTAVTPQTGSSATQPSSSATTHVASGALSSQPTQATQSLRSSAYGRADSDTSGDRSGSYSRPSSRRARNYDDRLQAIRAKQRHITNDTSADAATIINGSQPADAVRVQDSVGSSSGLGDDEQNRIDNLPSNFVDTVSFLKNQLGDIESGKIIALERGEIIEGEKFRSTNRLIRELLSEDAAKLQEYLNGADVASLQRMINNLLDIHAVLTEFNRTNSGVFTTLAKGIRALLHVFTFKKFFAPEEVTQKYDLTQLEEMVKRVVEAHGKKSFQPDAWREATKNAVGSCMVAPFSYVAEKLLNASKSVLNSGEFVAAKVADGSGQVAYQAGKVAGQVQHHYFNEKTAMGNALFATGRMLSNDVYATSLPVRYGYQTVRALPGVVFGKEVETKKLSETEKVGQEKAKAIVETASKPAVKYPILLGGALAVGFLAAGYFNSK